MLNVYNDEIISWCRDNNQCTISTDIPTLIAYNLLDYLKHHVISMRYVSPVAICDVSKKYDNVLPEKLLISGVPCKYIFTSGYYFEMEPGVWRLLVRTIEEYYAYADYMNNQYPITIFGEVYGSILEDYRIGSYGLKTDNVRLKVLQERYLFVGLNVLEVDSFDFTILVNSVNTKHYKDIDKKILNGAGIYLFIENLGWRKLCTSLDELKSYYKVLRGRGVL